MTIKHIILPNHFELHVYRIEIIISFIETRLNSQTLFRGYAELSIDTCNCGFDSDTQDINFSFLKHTIPVGFRQAEMLITVFTVTGSIICEQRRKENYRD